MNTMTRIERGEPMSFRREPPAPPPGNSFVRYITAHAIGSLARISAHDIAAQRYPGDKAIEHLFTRAATAPAMTTVSGWADALARTVVIDALEALGPANAAARLLLGSTVLSFDGAGIISAPGMVADKSNAGFVAEGAPIPVRQLATAPAQMQPHKLASIAALTAEMIMSSNAETLISDTLVRSAAAALDAVLFDANAGTAVRPAGLRYNVAASTPSNNADFWEAYFEDAATLVNSVARVGGNGPFYVIAGPGRATEMRMRALGQEGVPYFILGTPEVGNDMIAVAPAALVAAISPRPEVEAANAATLHMDSAPADIVGSGGAVAAGHKSMFQTDTVALKMRWRVTWALRDARGVAWLTPAWK